MVEKHLNFARHMHIETRILEGADPVAGVIDFARRNGITQIFVAQPQESSRRLFPHRDLIYRIISEAEDMQIVIVSDRERELKHITASRSFF